MVCAKCQAKLGKVITPDPWKAGARNTTESGQRRLNENKALTSKKNRFAPYTAFAKCRLCNAKLHQACSVYCQGECHVSPRRLASERSSADRSSDRSSDCTACAYQKGICAMCGAKLLSTAQYKQSNV